MNASEVKEKLWEFMNKIEDVFSGSLPENHFIVVGDAARLLRGTVLSADSIELRTIDPNSMDTLERNLKNVDIQYADDIRCVTIDDILVKDITSVEPNPYSSTVGDYRCERFDILRPGKMNLGLPYASYEDCKHLLSTSINGVVSGAKYKKTIKDWVDNATSDRDIEYDIHLFCKELDPVTYTKDQIQNITMLLNNNSSKVKYVRDFSGIAFGMCLDERRGIIGFRTPGMLNDDVINSYYPFNRQLFNHMDVIQRIEYMIKLCEFVPIRIAYEEILDNDSHRWIHIKRDQVAFRLVKECVNDLKCPPSDNVYYFIRKDKVHGTYYLARDLQMSPRAERNNKRSDMSHE